MRRLRGKNIILEYNDDIGFWIFGVLSWEDNFEILKRKKIFEIKNSLKGTTVAIEIDIHA